VRVGDTEEAQGLDLVEHQEVAYHFLSKKYDYDPLAPSTI